MTVSASMKLIESSTPVSQGAEARIYRAQLSADSPPILIKHRFSKKYRHEILDGSLTKARVAGEARALLKCLRSGVRVPEIRMVDASEGLLGLEWIEGHSVRQLLPGGEEPEETEGASSAEPPAEPDRLQEYGVDVATLMQLIGTQLARLHKADIIHGDLTTSNMMLRHPSAFLSLDPGSAITTELVLIDFGLSFTSALVEDKAVDLYVLERAFASTHPDSEPMFASVLDAYGQELGSKGWEAVKRRLDDVRLRGRKRSMVG
ncbi:kinase-like domain-containing protein [Coprinopsis sp. MPI-PUGE-AT-0042]|nr:kinase-like domain-containing protein [Coprinopsis sp. MPI-PUGE-AT-0042]